MTLFLLIFIFVGVDISEPNKNKFHDFNYFNLNKNLNEKLYKDPKQNINK